MEGGPRGSCESYGRRREGREYSQAGFRQELEQMYAEAPDELSREVIEKLFMMMADKEHAQALARYITTADPSDIDTYYAQKKLGTLLICDTTSPKDYKFGDVRIRQGDRLLQIHIPPRQQDGASGFSTGSLQGDIERSLQLTSDYVARHGLQPTMITGCTYDPIVRLMERRFGLNAVRLEIPEEWAGRVRDVFHRFIDPNVEPSIGFLYTPLQDFQGRFPPRG